MNTGCYVVRWLGMFLLFCTGVIKGETLQGPNVNPANLPVLVEWEKFTGQQAGVIGDNLSANRWDVYREALTFRDEGRKGAMAQQLWRWFSAFDSDGIIDCGEGAEVLSRKSQGQALRLCGGDGDSDVPESDEE